MKINNTRDLRAFLVAKMADVADEKLGPFQAKAICNLAQQVYNTLNLEIRAAAVIDRGETLKPVEFDTDVETVDADRVPAKDQLRLAPARNRKNRAVDHRDGAR